MNIFGKIIVFLALTASSAYSLEHADQTAMQEVIQGYTDAWNLHEGKGFADGFTDDADFVNTFGMHFSGKAEIEKRHVKILQNFLKGSTFEILDTQFREVQPGLVIAHVRWRLQGFRNPGSDLTKPGVTQDGIFTQVFINLDKKWEITASQNTLKPQ